PDISEADVPRVRLYTDVPGQSILVECRASHLQRQPRRVRYGLVSRVREVGCLFIVDRYRVAVAFDGDLHLVPIAWSQGWGGRETLQATSASRDIVDGARPVLVGSVGSGPFVDLDLETCVSSDPRCVRSDVLL